MRYHPRRTGLEPIPLRSEQMKTINVDPPGGRGKGPDMSEVGDKAMDSSQSQHTSV